MARYLLLRLIGMVDVVWLIGVITFCLMPAIPGGPWDEMTVTGALYTIGSVREDVQKIAQRFPS